MISDIVGMQSECVYIYTLKSTQHQSCIVMNPI